MPRSNRPRGSRGDGGSRGASGSRGDGGSGPDDGDEGYDLSRVLYGALHTESKRDGLWNVQSISASSAAKHYTCPSCGLDIAPGTAHIVAWKADGLMGAADDLAARRHWHSHCWKIK